MTTGRTAEEDALLARWRAAFAKPASGWDFSEFAGSVQESDPPWSYDALVREALQDAGSVLDLGTGGGEYLLSLRGALPSDTTATEGWAPNLPVARQALAPHHIPVSEYDAERGDPLPFPDGRFDLVLSRHEAFDAGEVRRVLRPGGVLLTQQVDGRNLADLAALLGTGPAYPDVVLDRLAGQVRAAGMGVSLSEQWFGPIRFDDVETLVSYLRLMPWQLPEDFTVDRYAAELLGLHRAGRPPEFTEGRFVIRASAP